MIGVKKNVLGSMAMTLLVLSLLLPAGPADSTPKHLSDRDQMTLRMLQLAQSGRLVESREVLRGYLQDNPTDGTMFYNLTCLDLYLHDEDQALVDLELALNNGYSNFRLLKADADLNPLRDDARFLDMVSRHETLFRQEFQKRAVILDEGYPLEDIPLQSLDPSASLAATELPQAAVSFDNRNLQVTLTVNDGDLGQQAPPWAGGCGVLVNLVLPLSPDEFESKRYFSYGFFLRNGHAEAALVSRHGEILLSPVPDLKPTITRSATETCYEISIPWTHFAPYGPPLDQDMGLNIIYLGSGDGSSRPVFALMPEYKQSFEDYPWRRFVTASFYDSDRSEQTLKGRLYQRLTESEALGYELAFWSETEGTGGYRLSIHTTADPESAIGEPVVGSFVCEPELNFVNQTLDLIELPTGAFRLNVAVTAPDGSIFNETHGFDNFADDWISSLNERIHVLQTAEQSILKYHLYALARQIENHHPFEDASGFHADHAALVHKIELCEAGQSCLPEAGLFRGGFTSGTMTQRFCAMYLPRGHEAMTAPQLLIVLPPKPGSEDTLARQLGDELEGRSQTIVIVPQSHGYSGLSTDAASNHAVLAIEWARQLFATGAVTLVGLGASTDAALETSLRRPDLCREILLDGDQLYRDLHDFSAASLGQVIGSRTNPRLYTLVSQDSSSQRLSLIETAMERVDLRLRILPLDAPEPTSAWLAGWYLTAN